MITFSPLKGDTVSLGSLFQGLFEQGLEEKGLCWRGSHLPLRFLDGDKSLQAFLITLFDVEMPHGCFWKTTCGPSQRGGISANSRHLKLQLGRFLQTGWQDLLNPGGFPRVACKVDFGGVDSVTQCILAFLFSSASNHALQHLLLEMLI